jgi:hypothetical protein
MLWMSADIKWVGFCLGYWQLCLCYWLLYRIFKLKGADWVHDTKSGARVEGVRG